MKTTRILLSLFFSAIAVVGFATDLVVTSNSMDASVAGSLPNIIASASSGDVISFNLPEDVIESPKETPALALSGINLTVNGLNKATGNKITFTGPEMLAGMSGAAILNLNDVIIKNKVGIPFKLSGGARLNARRCEFLDNGNVNNKNNGGVIRISSSIGDFEDCYFEGNACGGSYGGGAICAYGATKLYVKKCTFVENHASNGGAIELQGVSGKNFGDCRIENSTFVNNVADGSGDQRGGAIYVKNGGSTNSIIKPTIIYSTFVGNVAYAVGGAIDCFAMSSKKIQLRMVNNLVVGNLAGAESHIYDVHAWNANDRVTFDVSHNIFSAATKNLFGISDYNVDFSTEIIFKALEAHPNPDFEGTDVKTAKLYCGDNGIPVAMIAKNSFAIGKAVSISSTIPYFPTEDQLGTTRPSNPSVGAVEYIDGLDPTGIEHVKNENKFSAIFANGSLKISGINEVTVVSVFDLNGTLVCKGSVDNDASIQLSSLIKGLYFVRISDGINNETTKFIVY